MKIQLFSSKKLICFLGLFLFLSFNNTPEAAAQIVVKVRPAQPKVVLARPVKARSGHVWVTGHWRHNGNRYVWQKGSWVKNRAGHNWVAGKWVNCKGGHKWAPGHWNTIRVVKPTAKVVVVKKKNHHHHGKKRHSHKRN